LNLFAYKIKDILEDTVNGVMTLTNLYKKSSNF